MVDHSNYFPTTDQEWSSERAFWREQLQPAVNFALANEAKLDRNIQKALENRAFAEPPPWGDIIGKTRPREGPHGIILLNGKILTKWGDISRPDITFSVAKSFLSICAGLLLDDGIIPSFDDPIRKLVDDGGFDSDQNKDITWRQMLQMTSEWHGELWGKPDQVDHNRDLTIQPSDNTTKGTQRQLKKPGTHWEYNDVRVNRLSLALLRVAKQPLPDLLKKRIMDPISASPTWEWHGYENSWINLEGRQIQSVSGGSHWGGGLFINTLDQARIGLLMLNRGRWNGKQLLSENYISQALSPCRVNPDYGLFWWLNNSGKRLTNASRNSVCAVGFGGNFIWIEPDFELVCVTRWLEGSAYNEFCQKVLKVIRSNGLG